MVEPAKTKETSVPAADTFNPGVALAIEDEQSMTVCEALRRHPTAFVWSIVMSLTIVMEGYDISLVYSLFAFPPFVEKFGTYYPELGKKTIPGHWQVALGNAAAACGSFIGLLLNGYVTERFGHRVVTMVGLIVMSGVIFITFFAPNLEVLIVGQVLVGIPWGIFSIMGPAYSSEISPLALRGYLLAFVNICWVTGQFIGAGVLKAIVNDTSESGYRIPWAIQWAWPVPLILLAFFAPDSPWWLIRQGRVLEAKKSVQRLSSKLSYTENEQRVAMMGTNLRRTEIASMTLCSQNLPGQAMCYSASYFFIQAGLDAENAYKLSLGSFGLAFLATILSWILMTYFGRRTLMLAGLTLLCADLLAIGTSAFAASQASMWAQSALAVVWLAIYSSTIGPQSFTLAAEISAARLRSQTISIARNAYANLKGKVALVCFGIGVLTLIWATFRLPETKDKTFEELDILFEKRVPAWHFASTKLDVLAEGETLRTPGKLTAAEQIEDVHN